MDESQKALTSVLFELLSSSSSSSDESDSDDDNFIEELLCMHQAKKIKFDIDDIDEMIDLELLDQHTDSEFYDLFHVKKLSALEIMEKYKTSNSSRRKVLTSGKKLCPEAQILAFLRFASTTNNDKDFCTYYEIEIPTFHQYLDNIFDFFEEISSEYIKFPKNENELFIASSQFEEILGLQNIIGCINDYHLIVKKVVKVKSKSKTSNNETNENENVKKQFIITVQTVCDAKMNFIDLFIRASPRKDGMVNLFNKSIISKNLPSICKSNDYYILGSNRFPLQEYLMTPVIRDDGGILTKKQKLFNMKIKKGEKLINKTFEQIILRFKQLRSLNFCKIENMCKFILCCCIIHNICIKNNDKWTNWSITNDDDKRFTRCDHDSDDDESSEDENDEILCNPGEKKRRKIINNL